MDEDRLDFRPLDPRSDPEGFERAVQEIMDRAGPELAARRARATVLAQVASWRWPTLATAAAVAGLAIAALAARDGSRVAADAGVAEAIGVPGTVASWVREGELPDAGELIVNLEDAP